MTGSIQEGPAPTDAAPPARTGLGRAWRATAAKLAGAVDRLRLPGATVLPVAGAVVGLYGGLAAGVFTNLIGVVGGVVFGWPQVVDLLHQRSGTRAALRESLEHAHWHPEYLVIGVPLALGALLLSRFVRAGAARDVARRRLRVLALLMLGALALYYPLVGMAAVNAVLGHGGDVLAVLPTLPPWTRILVPGLGGALVGLLLEHHPGTRGHGVPEVVAAVQQNPDSLTARRGLRKLLASALTIGSGGSAGREGPIVYGGAAFGSAVGRTLGFSRRELSVLLAAGAGAGIAASFNTPIGGAVFALEIILREFELKVFSPIFLASVTATLVARGVMGNAAMLDHVPYQLRSGWEILAYAALGLLTGLLAYAFVRLLHWSEELFSGHRPGALSRWLGRQRLPATAAIGGLVVGALGLLSPTVWGVGHESLNLATADKLGLGVLAVACVLKLVATCITLGSGGSGGTFFAAVVIGGMGGGAFGELLRLVVPGAGVNSGGYALAGMGGCVAGFTRGPLTGLMIMYELAGNTSAILPLMVTCTLASALCHALVERDAPRALTEGDVLRRTQVADAMSRCPAVPASTRLRALFDQLVSSESGALPVLNEHGQPAGLIQVEDLREIWNDARLDPVLVALDLMRPVLPVLARASLAEALARMDAADLDALPVVDPERPTYPYGIVTRDAAQRVKRRVLGSTGGPTMAPTEES